MPASGAANGAPQIILAFDFGTRRIGVASGDTLTGTARALKALQCTPDIPWSQIDRLIEEYRPQQFVVGVPYNMDGTPTLLTKASRRFAHTLKARYAQPTALVDERQSSREASEQLRDARARGLKRRRTTREDIDMIAARILLERWFDDPAAATEV